MQSVYSTAPDNRTTCRVVLPSLQRFSRCILYHQSIRSLVGEVLLLYCCDLVGVFYTTNQLGHLLGKSYNSTVPANWATCWRSRTLSAAIQSAYSTAQDDWAICLGGLTPLQATWLFEFWLRYNVYFKTNKRK